MQLAATTPFGEVLFTGEKYPKAAGDTGAEGPFQGQTPPFPRTPFGDNMGPPHEPSEAGRVGRGRAAE